ncbi:MAG: phosphoglycerate dehydrogenase, partial [Candidatus Methanomethylophilaceae archaeon]|nr:phosphoglycerate dehydrogenase [Candidatus Methanomethylophilaceae archaeon]
ARGGIVNEDDLYTALKEGIIAGAAFDVWCNEPLSEDEKKLLELGNLVTTPHLGASTAEAQERVAIEIAEHAVMYLKDGIISNAINAPRGKLDAETEPFVILAERMGSMVQQTVGNHPLNKLEITYCGNLSGNATKLLTAYAAIGYLKNIIGTANTINALPIAKSKGVDITEGSNPVSEDYASAIEMRFTYGSEKRSIRGTVIGGQMRLVGFDSFSFDIPLFGNMVYVNYDDAPGVIGIVGNNLGKENINIGQMSVGRSGRKALMFLTADRTVPQEVVSRIASEIGSAEVRSLCFKE